MALADRSVTEILTAICPGIVTSGVQDLYTDISAEETSSTFFGKFYNYAIALRAAHYYSMDKNRPTGDAGLVTAKQEGRLQMSFLHNMTRNSKTDLGMTMYGQRLQSLIRSMGPVCSISSTNFDLDNGVFFEADEDYI